MFDGKRLRAAMVMAGKSVKDICDALNINASTFYRKMERNGDFSREEISVLVKELDLDDPESIFFV